MVTAAVVELDSKHLTENTIIVVESRPENFYARHGKRLVDVAGSSILLLFMSPILLIVSIAARLSLDKGLLFRQERVGRSGATFECLKFRTMEHDRREGTDEFDGSDRRRTHKSDDDPRHTRVGRIMRKFSLDELPQLVNIIRGDMSLVGPRPELVDVASADFIDHPRHWVRPGLTGPYQVSELRRTGDLKTGLRLDAEYVGQLSFFNDINFLLKTVVMVLKGQGA